MAVAITWYDSRSTRPLSSTRASNRRPRLARRVTGWAAARLSACCSRRSTPKSSARIGWSNDRGVISMRAVYSGGTRRRLHDLLHGNDPDPPRLGEHADDRADRLCRHADVPSDLRRRHPALSLGQAAKDVSVELAPEIDRGWKVHGGSPGDGDRFT